MSTGPENQFRVDIYVDSLTGAAGTFRSGERVYIKWIRGPKSGLSRVGLWNCDRVRFDDSFPSFTTMMLSSSSSASSSPSSSATSPSDPYQPQRIVFAVYTEGAAHSIAKNSFFVNSLIGRGLQKINIHFRWEGKGTTHSATLMVKMRVRRSESDGESNPGGEVPERAFDQWEMASNLSHNSIHTDNMSMSSTASMRTDRTNSLVGSSSVSTEELVRAHKSRRNETPAERKARLMQELSDKRTKLEAVEQRLRDEDAKKSTLLQWIDKARTDLNKIRGVDAGDNPRPRRVCNCF